MGSIHPSRISPGMLWFAQRSCGFPSLDVLKARLEGLRAIWSMEAVPAHGKERNWMMFWVPSNPNHSVTHPVILSKSKTHSLALPCRAVGKL